MGAKAAKTPLDKAIAEKYGCRAVYATRVFRVTKQAFSAWMTGRNRIPDSVVARIRAEFPGVRWTPPRFFGDIG